ncbi:hypothetical protein ACES2L_05525 [Bdellovibrio bacteriovorus]
MKLERRNFIKLGLAQAFVLGAANKAFAQNPPNFVKRQTGPSILQGATDDSKTQFSIVYDRVVPLKFLVTNGQEKNWQPHDQRTITFADHDQQITKVFFKNLSPEDNYFLHVIDESTEQVIDVREFKTLDLNKESVNFALCSCMHDMDHKPEIWRHLVNKNPDVIFFIGDSVYLDSGLVGGGGVNPEHMWKRFCESRKTLEIYYSKKLIPILATWDDHDFGKNDTNSKDFPYVKESQDNFLSFFAQDTDYCDLLKRGPGVSSAFHFRQQLFLLMDDRSFRERRGSRERFGHWGQEQETWMLQLVRNNQGPTWLFNGSQLFPNVPWKESLSGDHPVNFAEVVKELKTAYSKVIFGSGDVHYSEISRIEASFLGYQTYEVTSSSIHSRNIPGSPDVIPNNRRIIGNGQRNFVLVESTAKANGASFSATSFSANDKAAFQLQLSV